MVTAAACTGQTIGKQRQGDMLEQFQSIRRRHTTEGVAIWADRGTGWLRSCSGPGSGMEKRQPKFPLHNGRELTLPIYTHTEEDRRSPGNAAWGTDSLSKSVNSPVSALIDFAESWRQLSPSLPYCIFTTAQTGEGDLLSPISHFINTRLRGHR